ncbi:MAG: hypothetical protein AABW73_00265 [Nanoarchaeota archaeon]
MEKDVGKVKKNADTDIIIRVDDFGGKPGVTIREFVNGGSGKYSGFTKSGTRISLEEFPKFKDLINSIDIESLDFSDSTPKMPERKPFVKGGNSSYGASKPSFSATKKEEKEVEDDDAGSADGEEYY